MSIGFRIAKRTRKVDEATVERFRALPVANVSDCMARMTAGGARLRPMHAGGVMAGPALTVKTRPGDRSEEHTSELQPLMRISYAVFLLKKKKQHKTKPTV